MSAHSLLRGPFAPNGIGLSPDGSVLYVAETDSGRLWAWDVITPGEVRRMPWPSPNGGRLAAGLDATSGSTASRFRLRGGSA